MPKQAGKSLPSIRIHQFREQLHNRQTFIGQLQEQIATLTARVSQLEKELSVEQEQTRIQAAAIKDLESQLTRSKETIENVNAQLKLCRERADLTQKKLTESTDREKVLHDIAAVTKGTNEELEEEIRNFATASSTAIQTFLACLNKVNREMEENEEIVAIDPAYVSFSME